MDKFLAIRKISEKYSIPVTDIIESLVNIPKQVIAKKPKQEKKEEKFLIVSKKPTEPENIIRKKYLFLEKDYHLLEEKIEKILAEIARIGSEIGESCDETETFHDNFDYEEGGRQQKMWTNHLRSLRYIKEHAEIIKDNKDSQCVSIGREVTVKQDGKEIITKIIGSYSTFSDTEISYNSPLAKIIMGKKAGEKVEGKIHGKHSLFEILSIKQP